VDKVLYLSGSTRGATLENIGRSLGRDFGALGLGFIEVSLLDHEHLLENLRKVKFEEVKLIYSWASIGLGINLRQQDGTERELWKDLGIPFITFHGDSPAYFFDRHIVPDTKFVTIYGFDEHRDLRKRLPHVNGPIDILWPLLLDEIPTEQLNFEKRKNGKILFLKNGKDPARLRQLWASCLEPRLLQAIHDLASELERDLDNPANTQIDDLITRYFNDQGFDIELMVKLRLFFIAQLDDYLRAVKCTRMAEALMDLPVEIRGNNWEHLDFTGKKVTYINECDYTKSIVLVRSPSVSSTYHPIRSRGLTTALCAPTELTRSASPTNRNSSRNCLTTIGSLFASRKRASSSRLLTFSITKRLRSKWELKSRRHTRRNIRASHQSPRSSSSRRSRDSIISGSVPPAHKTSSCGLRLVSRDSILQRQRIV
jgi:hypothetical protein